ncbi:nucleotidyltransferase [Alkalicoccus luteus]|uniref:tRNA(Met) cytidine acetate ligase n=1 Tax=Alkalicoccus luteus TaxID=1237094 RepID=A0A969PLN6_9BACI|nr:nucleotidyltransferase [Alkalicoccus luteus]NJP36462.1 nucleotidyltransferase [Alkalicoccus luteus]
MNILGVVVEYNPFHYGHAFHLQASKEKTEADLTIAIMSGSFLQRGEPAVLSSYDRAAVAAKTGCDLVFELPYAYAVQSADRFADGAVRLLKKAGATGICFGSEQGSIDPFLEQADIEKTHSLQLKQILRSKLNKGISFPAAYSEAVNELSVPHSLDVKQPNNILGLHYVKSAIREEISVDTIQRIAADYHDPEPTDSHIASATSIRIMLSSNRTKEAFAYVPERSASAISEQLQATGIIPGWENYYPYLQYRILTSSTEELMKIAECREGIEFRLKAAAEEPDFSRFMYRLKSKRYTQTSLQRLSTHILTNTTAADMEQALSVEPPLHLLAATSAGRKHLRLIGDKDIRPTVKGSSQRKSDPLSASAFDVHQLAFPVKSRLISYQQHAVMI